MSRDREAQRQAEEQARAQETSDMERINPSALEEARAEAQWRNDSEAEQLAEQEWKEAALRFERLFLPRQTTNGRKRR